MVVKLPTPLDLGGLRVEGSRAIGATDAGALSRVAGATADAFGALGKGIAKAGEGLVEYELDKGRYENAQANSLDLSETIELDRSFADDRDYATRQARYEKARTEIRDRAAALISSPPMRERWLTDHRPQFERAVSNQVAAARRQEGDAQSAFTEAQGDKFIEQATQTEDREVRREMLDNYGALVDGLVARGTITEMQGMERMRRFAQRYAHADYLAAVNSGNPERIDRALNDLRSQPGSRADVVSRILKIEGDGKDPRSRAVGGFIPETWIKLLRQHRPDLAEGKSDKELEDLRADRNLRVELAGKLYDANVAGLKSRGVEATPGNSYLAHFFGPGVAAAVIKAPPGAAVADVIAAVPGVGREKAQKIVEANPEVLQGKQAGSVVAWAASKMGGADQGSIYRILPPEQREQMLAQGEAARARVHTTDRAAFGVRVQDVEAEAAATGGQPTRAVPRAEFIATYGAEEGARRYDAHQGNIRLAADTAALADMTPEQVTAVMQRYEPKPGPGYAAALDRQVKLGRAIQQIAQERQQDPGGFAVSRLPAVSQAYGDFIATATDATSTPGQRQTAARVFAGITLAEQARVGIPDAARRIVPKNYVDELHERITKPDTAGGPANVAQRIQAEAALWGDQWPLVYRDLQAKTTPIVRVIGSGVTPYAARVLVENQNVPLNKILDDQGDVKTKALQTEVREKFAPLRQSLAGNENEQAIFNDFQAMGEKLAAHYVRGGKDETAAAKQAFEDLVGHKYDFVPNDVGGGLLWGAAPSYRVPKAAGVPKETVQAGVAAARRQLAEFNLTLPVDDIGGVSEANRKAAAVSSYRRDGIWVTAPGDVGLMLVYKDQAVRKADGTPLIITWEGLEALAKSGPRAMPMRPELNGPSLGDALDWLKMFNPISSAKAQTQDSEGNIAHPFYKHTRETREEHQERIRPFREKIEPLVQTEEARLGVGIEKWSPQQLHRFQNSKPYRDLLKTVPYPEAAKDVPGAREAGFPGARR